MNSKDEFEVIGFITGVDALSPQRVDYYSEKYRSFIAQYHSHPDYSEWTYYRSEVILRWVAELAAEQSLLDRVEQLIGPDILLWNAFLPAKAPATDSHFGCNRSIYSTVR